MAFLSGRRLTAATAALIAAAGIAAVRVAASGDLAPRERPAAKEREEDARRRAADLVVLARKAQAEGDVAGALARFRAAVALRPQLADRGSPEFLGAAFEEQLKGWIAGMRKGAVVAPAAAFDDASYLFRRIYGGCG